MSEFLSGIAAASSLAVGLIFLRMWRETDDRFFALFSGAFWVLAINWIAVVLAAPANEHRHYLYLIRLAAFLLIIIAIVDKNRSSNDAQPGTGGDR